MNLKYLSFLYYKGSQPRQQNYHMTELVAWRHELVELQPFLTISATFLGHPLVALCVKGGVGGQRNDNPYN